MKMKRLKVLVLLFMLCSSTSYGAVIGKPVSKMEIVSPPTKQILFEDEDLVLDGIMVRVTFIDGEELYADSSDLTYTGFQKGLIGSQLVAVMYGDSSIIMSVTVQERVLTGIDARLNKQRWFTGDTVTNQDISVYDNYGNVLSGWTVSPNKVKEGRNVLVVSYGDFVDEITINADDNTLQSLRILETGPIEFLHGEVFSSEGIVVLGTYRDGKEYDVTDRCNIQAADTNMIGTQFVTVSLGDSVTTYSVNVMPKTFVRMDTSKYDSEGTVDLYFQERDLPITVGGDFVKVTNDNKVHTREFVVYSGMDVYTVTEPIPEELIRYTGSSRICVDVPIGVILETFDGSLGYVEQTGLRNLGESNVFVKFRSLGQSIVTEFPEYVSIKKEEVSTFGLHIPNVAYSGEMYLPFTAEVIVDD